jgi:hypothetical protein
VRNPRIEELFLGLTHSPGFQGLASRVSATGAPSALRVSGLTLTAKAVYAALLYRETGERRSSSPMAISRPRLCTHCCARSAICSTPERPLLLPALDVLPGQNMSPHAEILADARGGARPLAHGKGGNSW